MQYWVQDTERRQIKHKHNTENSKDEKYVVCTQLDIYVFITITGSILLQWNISPPAYHPSAQ